jgi:hypothetical protein
VLERRLLVEQREEEGVQARDALKAAMLARDESAAAALAERSASALAARPKTSAKLEGCGALWLMFVLWICTPPL